MSLGGFGMIKEAWTIAVGLVLLSGPTWSQGNAGNGKKPLTPEAFLRLRSLQDPQFSPDGLCVAFVVNEPRTEEKRTRHIWLYEKDKNASRQLTYSSKSETSPRWSPDGTQMVFLSNRDGDEQQIYLLRMQGGEAVQLTKGKASVSEVGWSPDGKSIAFLSPDPKTEIKKNKIKDKDDAHVVDREDKQARLWVMDLVTKKERALDRTELARGGFGLDAGRTINRRSGDKPAILRSLQDRLYSVRAGRENKRNAGGHGAIYGFAYIAGWQVRRLDRQPRSWAAAQRLAGLAGGARGGKKYDRCSLDREINHLQSAKDGSIMAVYAEGFRKQILRPTSPMVSGRIYPTNP